MLNYTNKNCRLRCYVRKYIRHTGLTCTYLKQSRSIRKTKIHFPLHNVPKKFMPISKSPGFSRERDNTCMFLKCTNGFLNYIISRTFQSSCPPSLPALMVNLQNKNSKSHSVYTVYDVFGRHICSKGRQFGQSLTILQ
jgi:hypothetical protein